MTGTSDIVGLEAALLRPEIRRDRKAAASLLTSDAVEVDSLGRSWTAEEIVEALATQQDYVQTPMYDVTVVELAAGAALLTYRDEALFHSSVWVQESPDGWRLRFHQQTRMAESNPAG